jgi:xanthine/uracil/vitamin C permease (AzgA family)
MSQSQSSDPASEEKESSAARLFDIRRLIGGLFTLYGVVLIVAGLVDGEAAKKKAAGIDINIWTGVGMLLVGIAFLVWMWLNPVAAASGDDAQEGAGARDDH